MDRAAADLLAMACHSAQDVDDLILAALRRRADLVEKERDAEVLTGGQWAKEAGVTRQAAAEWRTKAGLSGSLARSEWRRISPPQKERRNG